ncbi:MAG: hypothetical protein CAPSK01_004200 [Candidatus Accumulibacter vicinus]|uniref:Uncharacterized protein n=1 Tax=Candidatus Accumulibacter vicinus TaxID=2954382 RepID=A0A084XVM7_9PROT|nr:MAG: hypothetical protein CAPSK01_004200 [Candidatus Accumulibacter vicinus]
MIGLAKDIEHRAALLGVAVQNRMQSVRGETIRKLLSPFPVVDADESVVGRGVADACSRQRTRQPTVTIAVELKPERAPSRHAQEGQAQCLVDEIEVVVQTLARGMAQEGLMCAFVVPRLVGVARFHRGEDMHQSWVIATFLDHRGNDVFLPDVRLRNVLDLYPLLRRQSLCSFTDTLTQRFRKARVVKNPDVLSVEKTRHSRRVASTRQGARNHDPVIAGKHSSKTLFIAIRQHLGHGCLHSTVCAMTTASPSLVPASPA